MHRGIGPYIPNAADVRENLVTRNISRGPPLCTVCRPERLQSCRTRMHGGCMIVASGRGESGTLAIPQSVLETALDLEFPWLRLLHMYLLRTTRIFFSICDFSVAAELTRNLDLLMDRDRRIARSRPPGRSDSRGGKWAERKRAAHVWKRGGRARPHPPIRRTLSEDCVRRAGKVTIHAYLPVPARGPDLHGRRPAQLQASPQPAS